MDESKLEQVILVGLSERELHEKVLKIYLDTARKEGVGFITFCTMGGKPLLQIKLDYGRIKTNHGR